MGGGRLAESAETVAKWIRRVGRECTHDWSPSGVATTAWWPDGSVLQPTYSRVVRVKEVRSLYGDVMRSVSIFWYA